jgi:hypothetical protein
MGSGEREMVWTSERKRWLAVVAFGIAMAWMEAATVYYLRLLVGRVEPYQSEPLPLFGSLGWVEMVREAATLGMLAAAGALAGRTARSRFGYFVIAFGIWDIFYYVFLAVMGPWPRSVWDWDILFLLPLPWWGPVLAPVCVALLMILWGTLVSQRRAGSLPASVALTRVLGSIGIALALYAFLADALHVVHLGGDATRTVLPQTFNWSVFVVALTLMAAPVAHMTWRRPLGTAECTSLPRSRP